MNKQKHILLALGALVLISLSACMEPDTVADTGLDLHGGKDLYGVWEKSTVGELDLLEDGAKAWYFVFSDTACYLVNEYRDHLGVDSLLKGATGWGVFVKTSWSSDSNSFTLGTNPYPILSLSEKWPSLISIRGINTSMADIPLKFRTLSGGITYAAHAYTNLDTLSWYSNHQVVYNWLTDPPQGTTDTTGVVKHVFVPKPPYEFVVLSFQDFAGDKTMHITDKPCYDRNKGGDIDKLCEVSVFYKRGRPYLAEALQHVDTISTTAAFYPTGFLTGADSTDRVDVVEVPRGEEWWK